MAMNELGGRISMSEPDFRMEGEGPLGLPERLVKFPEGSPEGSIVHSTSLSPSCRAGGGGGG